MEPGAYAKYKSNTSINVMYDLVIEDNVVRFKSLKCYLELCWKVLEVEDSHAKILFDITCYNISSLKVKEFVFKGSNLAYYRSKDINVSIPCLSRSAIIMLDLTNRSIFYNSKYIGEWFWFIRLEEAKSKKIILVNETYPIGNEEFNTEEKPMLGIYGEGIISPPEKNFAIDLGFIKLPSTRLAVLNAPFIPSPYAGQGLHMLAARLRIYYDLISGIIVKIDLWYVDPKAPKGITPGCYRDSLLLKALNVLGFSSITKLKDQEVIPASIILFDTNIPLERPIFGSEVKKADEHLLFLSIISILLVIFVLCLVLKLRARVA